ncbi:MAG: dual specificity protein phosphatase family protein [Deltaproteobacteria bacterium]|nr:dual specificity protein phosphatase family protein [Deltaproteobacteria bacterium]
MDAASGTGLVLAAWRMKDARTHRHAAPAWLRERRPTLAPNPTFMELLLEWERGIAR